MDNNLHFVNYFNNTNDLEYESVVNLLINYMHVYIIHSYFIIAAQLSLNYSELITI